ncbi:ATP-binding protein [Curtobacterium sp. NPDC090217]|uniref:ATP-binding protein n=1 Tax=Curtobacterium sp. NPDC090217 TaxID=3363970 RepID=UPI003801290B
MRLTMETSQGDLTSVVSLLRAAGTDTEQVEAKAAVRDLPRTIWTTVSAFSNGSGGLIVLGLDEAAGFVPADGFDASATQDRVADGFRPRGAQEPPGPLTPVPHASISIAEVDGSPVVVVDVYEAAVTDKPTYVTTQGPENGTYERVGDGDRRMSRYGVYLLSSDVRQPADDRQEIVGASVTDLDSEAIRRFIERVRSRRPRAVVDTRTDDEVLRRFNVITGTGVPTLAGLLTLGKYPQEHFPQLVITFASYPAATKAGASGDVRMLDRRTLDGPIPDMIDDAVRVVDENLRHRRVSAGGAGARDVPEIPLDAIREAVTNAVSHRDYSDWAKGAQVQVELYADRLEVNNPGGIWGGRNVTDLYDGESRSRNAVLASLLTEVPLRGRDETVSENAGSGIPRMTGVLEREGLAAPKFIDARTSMTVTLDRHGLLDPEMDTWLTQVGAADLPEDQRKTLALVHSGRIVDDGLLEIQLGIDRRRARDTLDTLVHRGWLQYPKRVGAGYTPAALLIDAEVLGGELLEIFHELPETRGLSPEERIIEALRGAGELSIHELADRTSLSVPTLRQKLRVLIDQEVVWPTALPQSRNRRYQLRRAPRAGQGLSPT